MNAITIGIIGITGLLALFAIGTPIAFAMAIAGLVGFSYMVSPASALNLLAKDIFEQFSSYPLSVIPMFVLMGSLAFSAGIGKKAFDVTYVVLGQLRGGLIVATVGACAIFGAVCGSSAATTASIGKIAVPEMKKYRYSPSLSLGALACSGGLGIMIPPSTTFILYGVLTQLSIGKLFISGILPGIMLAILLIMTAMIICRLNPLSGPPGKVTTLMAKIKSTIGLMDAIVLFILVIGGLFAGLFSPGQAGAIGCAGAIVIGIARREMTWKRFVEAVIDSLRLSCMILLLIAGATVFGHFIAVTNLSTALVNWVEEVQLSSLGIIALVCVVFFILGMFIDMAPIVLLCTPIFFPMILKSGYDPIWFGVIIVLLCMIGMVTPPVGVNVFVTKGLVREEVPLNTINSGVMVFIIPLIVGLILLIVFPQIATALPSVMSY